MSEHTKRGWRVAVTTIVVAAGVTAQPAQAALEPSGHPITSFGGDGAVQTNFATVDTFAEARGLAIQQVGARAGQIVIAGGYQDGFDSHIAMLRINPDGSQDFGFGTAGETKTVIGSNDLADDVAIQADDKIVVAGFSDQSAMVVRYTADGVLDTTFGGGDGVVTFQVLAGQQTRLASVVIQGDGKILVAGSAIVTASIPDPTPNEPPFSTPSDRAALVARLNANGAIDTTFGGGDGFATINLTVPEPTPGFPDPNPPFVGGTDSAAGLALQADGKVVWVGRTINVAGTGCNGQVSTDQQSLIGRLNADGTPDNSFDSDGTRVLGLGTTANCPDDAFRNVTIQGDGKIVAVGYANTTQDASTNAKNNVSVARFNADGGFDNSFSGDGRLATPIASTAGFLSDVADDVVVLGDGRIVVGASTDQGGPGPIPGTFVTENDFAALRYNADGGLDNTFSGDGIGIYDFSANDVFDAMVLDATGRPVLAGYSYVVDQFTDPLVAVARVATSGALDATFNPAAAIPGTFFKALQGGSVEIGAAVVRQAVGVNADKLVVVGSTDTGSQTDVGLARYTATGALDSSFDGDGKATGNDANRNDAPSAAAVQPDDRIVVAGTSFGTSGAPRATVMRFNANGGLDTNFDGDGIVQLTVGTNANQWDAVTIGPDGDIWVAGTVSDTAADWDLFVARYNANGSPDNGFDGDGWVRLSLGAGVDQAQAIALQPDGAVVVGGSTFAGSAQHFALVRLTATGAPDSAFGGGDGIVTTPIGSGAFPRNEITGLAIQADGRIVAAGNGNDGGGSTNNVIRVARYLPGGSPDATFGSGGIVSTNLAANRFDRAGGVALQRDEKVVVFGNSLDLSVGRDDLVIARYNWDDGSLDTTFGDTNSGATVLAASPGSDIASGGVVFPDGSAAIGGTVGSSDVGAARYAGDPSPVLPAQPALAAASDSGSSNSDRVTNDNTPTILGASCNIGDTTIVKIDGSTGNPLRRSLCRTGSYTVTSGVLADGQHTLSALARNGAGDSADSSITTITIDTVANPPTIVAPLEAASIDLPPNPTVSGTVSETIAGSLVEVREGGATVCSAVADGAGAWSCVAPLLPGPHTVTARLTDVAGNVSLDSPGRSFGVRSPTTTLLTSSVDPSVYGETITFTATVTAVSGIAAGDVEFVIDGSTPTAVTLDASGVATLAIPNPPGDPLDVGEHTVSASFLGSTYFQPSADDLDDDQSVEQAATTVEISTPSNPSGFGAPATFTFTAQPVAPGAGVPTGSVEVAIDAGTPQVLALAAGQATLTTDVLLPGSHTITATYQGDSRFTASTLASLAHTVSLGGTTTTVSSSGATTFGETVTFTATVAGVPPAPGAPTGSVAFSIDGGPAIDVALSGATATLETASLTAGAHAITATYVGDARFARSSGTLPGGHTVTVGASTTAVSVSPSPSVFGQTVTITASVEPVAPAPGPLSGPGSIVIDGGAPIVVAFVDGTASLDTASLGVGVHTIQASFDATPNIAGSTGNTNHTVDQAGTATTVSAAPNPATFGAAVTFTAAVAAVAPGAGTPTGSVEFVIDGGAPIVRALTAGVASLETAALAGGAHTVVANYTGDVNFLPSDDQLDGGQAVARAGTTTSAGSSPNPAGFGETVEVTVSVAAQPPSTAIPTGNVTASVDGSVAATVTLVAGAATISLDDLAVGTRAITVAYSGDGDHAPSSTTIDPAQVIEPGASATSVTASSASTAFGAPVSFTATVSGVAPAPGTPTGSVQFTIDGGSPVTVALSGGSATLTTSALTAGAHTVSVNYPGDGSFVASAADLAGGHTVTVATTTLAVTSSLDPAPFGAAVTFTVAVIGGAPVGPVSVSVDGATPVAVALVAGRASLTLDDLGVGEHTVAATYAGDANHAPSSGALAEPQTITAAPVMFTLTASANPSPPGQPVSFTASVDARSNGGVPQRFVTESVAGPTGTVTFVVNGVAGAPVPLAAGQASTTLTLAPGSYTVTAVYSGDANYQTATTSLAGQLVVQAPPRPSGRLPATGGQLGLLALAAAAALALGTGLRRAAR